MTFAAKIADAWTVLPVGQPVTLNEISVSWETLMLWSDEEREAFGVFAVPDPDAPPSGKVEASRALKPDGERPEWVVVYVDAPPPAPEPVPESVTNFQARATMRSLPMPDGRSLFSTVDGDLRAAVEAVKGLPEFDVARIDAELHWQAWEQANDYMRDGAITEMLAARYGFDAARTDALFRQASKVAA